MLAFILLLLLIQSEGVSEIHSHYLSVNGGTEGGGGVTVQNIGRGKWEPNGRSVIRWLEFGAWNHLQATPPWD